MVLIKILTFPKNFIFQTESHSYFTSLKSIYHIASKNVQNDTKKVEVVEIQDAEVNGSPVESKSKNDTRWSDGKASIKKEPIDCEKDKKYDNKITIKKESLEDDKDKKWNTSTVKYTHNNLKGHHPDWQRLFIFKAKYAKGVCFFHESTIKYLTIPF